MEPRVKLVLATLVSKIAKAGRIVLVLGTMVVGRLGHVLTSDMPTVDAEVVVIDQVCVASRLAALFLMTTGCRWVPRLGHYVPGIASPRRADEGMSPALMPLHGRATSSKTRMVASMGLTSMPLHGLATELKVMLASIERRRLVPITELGKDPSIGGQRGEEDKSLTPMLSHG